MNCVTLKRNEMTKLRFWAIIFFVAILFISTVRCSVAPTQMPLPTEVPTMNSEPLSVMKPTSIPLTGEWSFSIDKAQTGEQQGWTTPTFDDSTWTKVSVPHTWNVMPEYSDYEGMGWYRRTFIAPAESPKGHLRLRFEAVFYLARVWLNGQFLGQHEGGYTPFEIG